MSSELALRLGVVGVVVALALVWALVSRRGTAFRRRRVNLAGLGPGVVLFTAETCDTCARARSVVDEVAPEYREVRYEEDPEVFTRHRIERVPAVARLDDQGRGWLAEGIPNRWLLRRWLD